MTLPKTVALVSATGTTTTKRIGWTVPPPSTLRLEQLLAQGGYLPLDWQPSGDDVPRTRAAQAERLRRRARRHVHLALLEHPRGAEARVEGRRGQRDRPRGDHEVPGHPPPHGRRLRRPGGVARARRRHDRRQAADRRLQLRLRAPRHAAAADALARRPHRPDLAGQHRGARRADRARHLPRVRAPRQHHDERHEPGRVALQRPGRQVGQLLQRRRRPARLQPRLLRHAAEPGLRRAPARRRPRRSGPTRRSARWSPSSTDRPGGLQERPVASEHTGCELLAPSTPRRALRGPRRDRMARRPRAARRARPRPRPRVPRAPRDPRRRAARRDLELPAREPATRHRAAPLAAHRPRPGRVDRRRGGVRHRDVGRHQPADPVPRRLRLSPASPRCCCPGSGCCCAAGAAAVSRTLWADGVTVGARGQLGERGAGVPDALHARVRRSGRRGRRTRVSA